MNKPGSRSRFQNSHIAIAFYFALVQAPSFGQAPLPVPPTATPAPLGSTTAPVPVRNAGTGNPFTDLQNANQELINTETALERERDRQGKLTKELLSESSVGCWLNQPLESLVVKTVGTPIDEKYIGNQTNPATSIGNGTSFTFRLSDEVAKENNEPENALFSSAGRLTIEATNKTIGSIRYLKIDKNGVVYFSKAMQKSKSSFFSKKTKKWNEIYERGRYQLSEISIEVNGQPMYKRTGLSHVFENGNMTYFEDEHTFKANAAYLLLRSRTDCAAGDRSAATPAK